MKCPPYDADYDWTSDQVALLTDYYFNEDPIKFLQTLPEWKRNVFHVSNAVTSIMNGGIYGYISGSHFIHFEDLIEALRIIGAHEMLETLISYQNLFPDKRIPKDYDQTIECMNQICKNLNVEYFDEIDKLIEVKIDEDIWSLLRNLEQ